MYSKWLRLCPPYNVYSNVVLFNVVLRGFIVTQRARGDNVSPWNIQQFIEIFTKRVPYAVSYVFYWFMDSPISLIILLLTPCCFIAHNIHECCTES